jgi:hypothetical protein
MFPVFLTLALAVCAGAALAGQTFYAGYNGNTGNGGLDADMGLGGTAVTSTVGTPMLISPGKSGSALDADYTADEFRGNDSVTYNAGANVPASGTIAMWVNLAWTPPQQMSPDQYYFFNTRTADYNNGFAIGCIYGEEPVLLEWANGTTYQNWAANIRTGKNWDSSVLFTPWVADEWHHLAATWGPGGLSLYGDGVLWRTTAGVALPVIPGDNSLTIGRALGNSSSCAKIDAVQIWDTVFTDAEIHALVPEPGSLLTLLTGAVAFGGIALRRRGR